MKKYVGIVLLIALLLCTALCAAENDEREIFTCGDYLYALLEDDTVEIIRYQGDESVLMIADTLDGYRVTKIGESAFDINEDLLDVCIPDGVTAIGNGAFYTCENLTSIIIPDSVTSIGQFAFENDTNLTYLSFPMNLTYIGDGAFAACSSLTYFYIPKSVTFIGQNVFFECNQLQGITVTRGSYAEQYCRENGLNCIYSDSLN